MARGPGRWKACWHSLATFTRRGAPPDATPESELSDIKLDHSSRVARFHCQFWRKLPTQSLRNRYRQNRDLLNPSRRRQIRIHPQCRYDTQSTHSRTGHFRQGNSQSVASSFSPSDAGTCRESVGIPFTSAELPNRYRRIASNRSLGSGVVPRQTRMSGRVRGCRYFLCDLVVSDHGNHPSRSGLESIPAA